MLRELYLIGTTTCENGENIKHDKFFWRWNKSWPKFLEESIESSSFNSAMVVDVISNFNVLLAVCCTIIRGDLDKTFTTVTSR